MGHVHWADIFGVVGAALIVLAYLLLQFERWSAQSLRYSLTNAVGAAGILLSLYFKFNLSAFAIEVFWLLISTYGVVRALRRTPSENTQKIEPQ